MEAPNLYMNAPKKIPSVGIRFSAWFTDIMMVGLADWALGLTKIHVKYPLFNYLFLLVSYLVVIIMPMLMSNRTLGKKIFKLKVKTNNGALIGIQTIFLREFVFKFVVLFMVPFAIGGVFNGLTKNSILGFAAVIGVYALIERTAKKHQAFFWDKICKTQVEYE